MSEQIVQYNPNDPSTNKLVAVLMQGNLATLNEEEKLNYYNRVCQTLGLNQFTKPFEFIMLNGKLQLYALKSCTEQLRMLHNVSITIETRQETKELYIVTARAQMTNGRCDESIGAVSIKGLTGESLSNAIMKAETKAKRRVTLSICGLAMLDETEVEQFSQPKTFVNLRETKEFEFASEESLCKLEETISFATFLNETDLKFYSERIKLTREGKRNDGRKQAYTPQTIATEIGILENEIKEVTRREWLADCLLQLEEIQSNKYFVGLPENYQKAVNNFILDITEQRYQYEEKYHNAIVTCADLIEQLAKGE